MVASFQPLKEAAVDDTQAEASFERKTLPVGACKP
jgi:hypothetical protein